MLPAVNGLTLLVVLALAVGLFVAYRAGIVRGRRETQVTDRSPLRPAVVTAEAPAAVLSPPQSAAPVPAASASASSAPAPAPAVPPMGVAAAAEDGAAAERARLVRSLESENTALRRAVSAAHAERTQLAAMAEDRRRLLREVAQARGEAARYRAIVVDLENNAMPPLLDGPNAPDDLKLIVGVGPVLERMLHQLGVTTYRQIARWTERDIDEFDARLPEFPGRIRRDGWVTQARELHLSKFGEAPPGRDR
jgi:predicted flap endonuclease-1-like 5' DNA nuclease